MLIAARIMMIIDLTHSDIIYDMAQDLDTLPNNCNQISIHHLIKEKWISPLAAESLEVEGLTNVHFDSKILKRIKLHHDNDIWMTSLSTRVGPYCLVYNKKDRYNTIDNTQLIIDQHIL